MSPAKVGAIAGLVWGVGLFVLLTEWGPFAMIVLPATCVLIGAVVTRVTSGLLASCGRLAALAIALAFLPVCACLCGAITQFVAELAARNFHFSDMLSNMFLSGWDFTYASTLAPPINLIVIPSFCLTVLLIQKTLVAQQRARTS